MGRDGRARDQTAWFVVEDLAQAVAVAAGRPSSGVLVLDIENTLTRYGASAGERLEVMGEAVDLVAGHGGFREVMFVSNGYVELPLLSHDSLAIRTVSVARKPYVRLHPLRRLRSAMSGAAVYGDQALTDGLLARNIGGVWLQPRHAYEASAPEPWWPRAMRWAGRPVTTWAFHPPEFPG